MSKLWLPFYDIGGGVGFKQPNHPLDIELCHFLYEKVKARVLTAGAPKVDWKGLDGGAWIVWLTKRCSSLGQAASSPTPGAIHPATENATSLIVALNALFHALYPAAYLNPTFSLSGSGSLTATNLAGHMATASNVRSEWLGLKSAGKGPKWEMPFYDQFQLVPPIPPGDGPPPLVPGIAMLLLKMIIWSNSPAKPAAISNISANPGVGIGLSVLPLFAAKFAELGWPCSNSTNIYPTYGNVNSDSLIIPINYFACISHLTGGPGGYMSMGYAFAHDSPHAAPSIKADLKLHRESRYFKC